MFYEKQNELYGEHLINKNDYIITSLIGDNFDYSQINKGDFDYVDYGLKDLSFINSKGYLAYQGIVTNFIISNIDFRNKFSDDFMNCTGIVAIGRDKDTNENISFLSHQSPDYILSDDIIEHFYYNNISKKKLFEKFLIQRLNELKNKSKKGTIDIIIIGGNNVLSNLDTGLIDYKKSIAKLDEIIYENIGFHPSVVGGPSYFDEDLNDTRKGVIVDTKNRKVSLFKKYGDITENINFFANKVDAIL